MTAALLVLAVFLPIFPADAVAQSIAAGLYNEANTHYRRGEYVEAHEKYGQIAASGLRNAALFYNLGNASFKLERIGEAILWYERALRLAPRDGDIAANLQFANLVKQDRDEAVDGNVVVAALGQAYRMPALNELSLAVSAALLAVTVLLIWRLRLPDKVRVAWTVATALATTGLVVAGLFLFSRVFDAAGDEEAILTAASEAARSAPDAQETVVFVIHEGTKVAVHREEKGWVLIRLRNGLGGWVPRASVTVI